MLKKILYFLIGISFASTAYAAQITVPSASSAGLLLQSLSTGNYSPVQLIAGSNITISSTTNAITISSTGGGSFPFTSVAGYNSTSTTLGLLNGFFSTASSTISGNFYTPNLSQGFLYVGSNGLHQTISSSTIKTSWLTNDSGFITAESDPVVKAINGIVKSNGSSISAASNGTDYTLITAKTCNAGDFVSAVTAGGVFTCTTPSGTTYTATYPIQISGSVISSAFSTTSNSGMSQGNLYVGSGGIFQTAASSSIFGFTPASNATTITVNGTSNQITSSAGAQDLSANRTWTLSFPNQVIFPQYASSTNGFSTPYASSTQYFGANLTTCNGGTNALTWSNGVFGCNTISSSGGTGNVSTSTNETAGRLAYWTTTSGTPAKLGDVSTTTASCAGSVSCTSFTILGSSPVTLTGTAGSGTGLSTSSPTSDSNILVYSSVGAGSAYGISTSTLVNNIFPFTTYGISTSSVFNLSGGLFTSASSTFSGALNLPSVALNSLLSTNATGVVVATSTPTFGQFYATSTTATSTITNALQFGGTARDNMAYFNCQGRIFPASISTGGCVNIDIGTQSQFPALVLHNNSSGAGTGRLFVINQEGTAATQDMIIASSSGSNVTALNVKGFPTGKGIIKIEHTGGGTGFSNASALSVDLLNATDAQGIFVKGASSGTGKLINFVDSGSATLGFFDSNGLFNSKIAAIGTTTNAGSYPVLGYSATAPQFALSAGGGIAQWFMRNAGGNFYLGTTTVAGTATTSIPALQINSTGSAFSYGTTSASLSYFPANTIAVFNNLTPTGNGSTASTTFALDNATSTIPNQIQMRSNTGAVVCLFVVGTTPTVTSGACN